MTSRFLCVAVAFTLQAADLLVPDSVLGQRLAAPLTPVAAPSLVTGLASRRLAGGGILGSGERDHRYTGFYVGLVVGLGIGVYAFADCASEGGPCGERAAAITVASMSLCAAAGAVIGALFRK